MTMNFEYNLIQKPASHVALNPFSFRKGPNLLAMFEDHTKNHIEYREFARVSAANGTQSSLASTSLSQGSTQGVRTRFPSSQELNTQKLLARAETAMNPHKRREKNLRIGIKIQSVVSRLKEEEIYAELTRARQARKTSETQRVNKLKALSQETETLQASIRDTAKMIDATRDNYEALISKERLRADDAERSRLVAVSSLRSRWETQRSDLQEEVKSLRSEIQFLRNELHAKNMEVTELKALGEESRFDVDVLKRKVAIMEDGDMMRLFSRQLSDALSEVSDVVLLRPHEGACMVDKFRELHEAVKELVTEVRTRRKNSVEMTERVFKLEEERLMWVSEKEGDIEYDPLK